MGALGASAPLLDAQPVARVTSAASATGPLLRGRDLATLGTFVVAAGALVPLDARIARWSQRPTIQQRRSLRGAAAALRTLGSPGALALGGLTYGVGTVVGDRVTADAGLHGAAAVVAGSVVTGTIKLAAGRARPYVTGDTVPTSFVLGRGLRRGNAYESLPSGHATAAFALAGALASEGARRWPAANRVTGPVAYTTAAMVALSRVYHDRHWASDVVLGAGIGATAGVALVRFAHSHPNNTLDRQLLPGAAAPRPLAAWTVHF